MNNISSIVNYLNSSVDTDFNLKIANLIIDNLDKSCYDITNNELVFKLPIYNYKLLSNIKHIIETDTNHINKIYNNSPCLTIIIPKDTITTQTDIDYINNDNFGDLYLFS